MKLSVIAPPMMAVAAIGAIALAIPLIGELDFAGPILLVAAALGVLLLRPRR
ncbi:MAG: hypothetical protein AAF416_20625 [Pseudomonadota bacterium]